MNPAEMLLSQKAALVAYHLTLGEGLHTVQVAEMTGFSVRQAQRLMIHLSECIPIYLDNGVWQLLDFHEEQFEKPAGA
jgi:hypothetical protein